MQDIELTPGRALILVGPGGCGKSMLAREVAARYGEFREATLDRILSYFDRGGLLASEPAVVIVDGFPRTFGEFGRVVDLVCSEAIECHRKGRDPVPVKTPRFIFCLTADKPLRLADLDPRRFQVINLGAGAK
jgi:hypothetical protein